MDMTEFVASIKSDLGGDVISLGISDTTVEQKVKESLRKIGSYAPRVITESLPVHQEKVQLPEGTIGVHNVLSTKDVINTPRGGDDIDIFSINNQMLSKKDADPTAYLLRKTELDQTMNFIEVTDWYFVKDSRILFLNYYNRPTATVKYLKKYTDVSEIQDDDIIDVVKNYALSLCKIVEGNIRRKLANAPGAIAMDGEQLVSEGNEEKRTLEESFKREFSNLRFGFRA